MPTYSITGPDGKVYSIDGPAGATQEQVIAQIQAANAAAPKPEPGILARIKNAVIAPEAERDATLKDAIVGGIKGIPGEIAKQFGQSMTAVGHDIIPQNMADFQHANSNPLGPAGAVAMDAAGAVFSPITGALTSAVGRPVEQATGLRRQITGTALSALVPLGGEAKAGNIAEDVAAASKPAAAIHPVAAEAHSAGYVLPPQMISSKPGIVANALAGWSGKVKTAQAASAKNQEVTNALAAKSLGLAPEADLTPATFNAIRADAGKAYSAIPEVMPSISADDAYLQTVSSLGHPGAEAAQRAFPNITKNQGIIDLQDELSSVQHFPTGAGIEIVKELRKQGAANLKAFNDPSKLALGKAQRQAADAVDGLIERNLSQTGDEKLVQAYKDARVKIAKSYDVQSATNPATWDVDAHKIAKLGAKGVPLTDELAMIAKTAQAFPKATQSAAKFGEVEPISVLDVAGSAVSVAHGRPEGAAVLLGRPLARKAILSKPVQNSLVSAAKGESKNALAISSPTRKQRRAASSANALYQLSNPQHQ